jgi:uncharacterized membrane protein YfcA
MPVPLVLIGLAAGFFSALFGVGGGVLIVPLLVVAASFGQREAAGTSLAAIVIIALVGAIAYGVRGEVDFGYAALVGLPAAAGALAGAVVQQRVPVRWLALAFAGLLLVVAAVLFA